MGARCTLPYLKYTITLNKQWAMTLSLCQPPLCIIFILHISCTDFFIHHALTSLNITRTNFLMAYQRSNRWFKNIYIYILKSPFINRYNDLFFSDFTKLESKIWGWQLRDWTGNGTTSYKLRWLTYSLGYFVFEACCYIVWHFWIAFGQRLTLKTHMT